VRLNGSEVRDDAGPDHGFLLDAVAAGQARLASLAAGV